MALSSTHCFLLKKNTTAHICRIKQCRIICAKTGLQVIKPVGVCVSACGCEADIPGVSRLVNIFFVSSFPSFLHRGVNIILHNLFQTTNTFPHLGCRTVATFASSSSNLPLSDSSLFLNWSFWRILFFSRSRRVAPHNSYFALLLLDVHNFLKVFSHQDKLFHTSFHYRNYFLPSFSLPKSFLPLRLYISFFPYLLLQSKLGIH